MSRRRSIACAAVLVAPLSLLTTPSGSASADDVTSRVVLADPTGDVWAIGEGEEESWVSAGDVPTADVTGAVIRHGRYNVVVTMTFTNLRRVEPQSYDAFITSRSGYGAMFVGTGPRNWDGRHVLVDEQYGKVKCPKLSHVVDYAAEQVTMTIPRSCLGRPEWVRVGLSNMMFRGDTEEEFQEVTDNPHTTDHEGSMTVRLHRDAD